MPVHSCICSKPKRAKSLPAPGVCSLLQSYSSIAELSVSEKSFPRTTVSIASKFKLPPALERMSCEMDTEIGPTDNAELYRKSTTVNQPLVHHNHLQFIKVFNDERFLLGASNMNGRLWNGSVWLYDDCSTFVKEKAAVTVNLDSGVCDATFIERDKFVVVEDSGVLQVFVVIENQLAGSKEVQRLGYACQHDDSILTTSVFHSKSRLVTGGMDCCLKVWSVADLIAEYSYNGAHRKIISCVDTKPNSDDAFASSSLDGQAVVWDVRKEKPAQVMYTMPNGQLLAVAWSPVDEHRLAVGCLDGCVGLVDVRKPGELVEHSNVFKKSIHRLQFDPKRPHLLAACSDDTEVKVVDVSKNFATVYHDNQHRDFVRGIAWQNDNLLSCSWDNTVRKHDIPAVQVVVK